MSVQAARSRAKARDREKKPPVSRGVSIELARLEIASGYDGVLRGAPEAVICVAAYALPPEGAPHTLLRGAFHVPSMSGRIPHAVAVNQSPPWAKARTVPTGSHVLLLAVGVEDDGGLSVGRVVGDLERAGEIVLATVENGHDAAHLDAIGASVTDWLRPRRVMVLVDGAQLSARCVGDDWIGASAVCVPMTPKAAEHRLHVVSDDARNDWTAVVTTRFAF